MSATFNKNITETGQEPVPPPEPLTRLGLVVDASERDGAFGLYRHQGVGLSEFAKIKSGGLT